MFNSNTDLYSPSTETRGSAANAASLSNVSDVDESVGYRSQLPINGEQTTDPRIVAIVPRGEVIRNFVYSGAFKYLSQEADLVFAFCFGGYGAE